MFNIKFTNKLFSISLLTLVFSVSSFAQEIEEVVVTATKKEESTQDIAVSITAVTSDQLEADQIYDLSDLAEIIPGFETAKGIGSGSGFVMRGIGSYGVGAAVVGSIVTSINGHSANANIITDMGFLDLERIEVLNGPQGTLFGRNSVAGVINLITKRPTNEFEGFIRYEGGSWDKETVQGAINLPLSDNVSARLAFLTNTRDGMVDNPFTGNVMDDRNDQGVRLSIDWDINDTTELRFTYSGQKSDDNRPQEEVSFCQQDQFFGCSPWERGTPNTAADSRGIGAGLFSFIAALYPGTITNDYGATPPALELGELSVNREPTHLQKNEFSNLELVKELSDSLTMTAKYSYETRMFQQMNDNDGSVSYSPFIGAGAGLGLPPIESEQCFGTPRFGFCEYVTTDRTYDFSDVLYESQQAEVNIISDFDGPLNYTVGYYMYDSRNDNEYRVQTPGTQYIGDFSSHPYYPTVTGLLGIDFGAKGGVPFYQGLLGVVALATPALTAQGMLAAGFPISATQAAQLQAFAAGVAALQALPDVTVPMDIRGTLSDQHVRIKSQALYGELYYDLNDTTKLTVGLRFDDLTNATTTYNGGILSSGWIAAGGFLYDDRMKVPGLVDYLVQNETATNGKIAIQKYLQDDVMVYASYSTATKGAGVNAGDDPIPYDKEETAVIDFGLKARLLDGAMLLNMNLYRNDNEGMLLATIRDTQSFNNNVDAEVTGFEGQMNVFLSETTQLEFSWLAVDAEITDAPATINYLNPWNANSVLQYLGPVDGNGTGFQTGAVMDNGTTGFKSAGFNCSSPFFAPAANVDCPATASLGVPVSVAGLPLPGVADLSYSLSMTQIFPMNNGETSWRLSYRYRDEVNGDPFNYSRFDVPEQKSWDTLIRYTPSNVDWYVGVYAKNLNDDRTINSIRSGSNIQGGQLYANFTDPRTWGVQFGAEF